jgi:hypothetical protein
MELARILPLTALAAATLLVGCGGGGGSDPAARTSELSISLMDAPVDSVTAVYVQITAMWIKPEGSGPAIQLPLVNAPLTVNLLELTDTNAAILVNEAVIEAGSYEWIAMDIAAERGVRDSYVLTDTGGEVDLETELRVPSGRLRLVSGFDVAPNQSVKLLFDWDMRQGLVNPPGQGQYLLKPAFRMLDVTEYGVLQGTVAGAVVGTSLDPAVNDCAKDDNVNLDVGNIVYVFAGADADVDDIDGTGDPIATVEATRNDAGDYVYRTVVDPGTYTVAFTCQAGNDDPATDETGAADEIEFLPDVNATNAGDVTIVNFSPPPPAAP